MGKKRKRISVEKFKELATDPSSDLREQLPSLVVCRSEPFELELKEVDGQLTPAVSEENKLERVFTISTPVVDRDGDVLDERWELDNFNKGGSVLFGHVSNRPEYIVAAPRATWVESKRLRSRAEFTPREVNPLGYMVFRLIDFGALRGASVGFRPIEFEEAEDRDGFMPMNFGLKELLEYSMTPVPANPDALDEARSAGIDLDPFAAWAEEVLDSDTDLVVVSKDLVKASWDVVRGKTGKSTITVPEELDKGTSDGSAHGDESSEFEELGDEGLDKDGSAELDIQAEIAAADERLKSVFKAIGLRAAQLATDVVTLTKVIGERSLSDEHLELLRKAREQLDSVLQRCAPSDEPEESESSDPADAVPSAFDRAFEMWSQGDRVDVESEEERPATADELKSIADEVLGNAMMRLTGRVPDQPPSTQ